MGGWGHEKKKLIKKLFFLSTFGQSGTALIQEALKRKIVRSYKCACLHVMKVG
jgi:hypothetical protein